MSGLSVSEGDFGELKVRAFAQAMGYKVVQILGQRIFGGPPPNWIGLPPTRKCEVFVGRLPRDCFEDEIVPVLCSVGPIYEMRLMMAHIGGTRGFAFVKYTNENDANNAVVALNGYQIRPGMLIGVKKSLNNCKLFVGEFPENFNKQQIMKGVKICSDGIMDIKFCSSRSWHSDEVKCFYVIIEFETHRDAALARRNLCACSYYLWNMTVNIKWLKDSGEQDFRMKAERAESQERRGRNIRLINGKTLEEHMDENLRGFFITSDISAAGVGWSVLESGSMHRDSHKPLSVMNVCNEGRMDSVSQLTRLPDPNLPSSDHDLDGREGKIHDSSLIKALGFLGRHRLSSPDSHAAQKVFSVWENNSAEKYSFGHANARTNNLHVQKYPSTHAIQNSQIDFGLNLDKIISIYNNNNNNHNLELREILFKKNCDDSVSYSL